MMARPMTPHYSIPQYGPQGTKDPMAVYSVYNPAMKVIDDILWAFKGRMDGLEQRVADLEGRMDAAEAEIEALKRRMTQAETDIDNLENRMDAAEESITNLGDRITEEVNKLNQTINSLKGDYDATLADIVNKFYGGGSIGEDGHVSWGDAGKAATGNMNVFGNSGLTSYIRTVSGNGTNSVRVN